MTVTPFSPAMIGRVAQLDRLRALLSETRELGSRAVVVSGEAGIGKSRLLTEFESGLPDDVLCLRGQCVDLGEVAAPYAPVKDLLRALIARAGADAVLEAAGPGRPVLAALLPELGEASTSAAGGAQLHEAVAVVLEAFSREHPLVVLIEDLHWVDTASLSLLRFLLRTPLSGHVLTVLSYRVEDVPRRHPVRELLIETGRSRGLERIELARLTREQVRSQVRAITGDDLDDAQLDNVVERAEGVPFFVEELIGIDGCSTDAELPETLRELLLARYLRLSEPAKALLRLLSVGGVRTPHPLVAAVSDLDEAGLEAAAREAVESGVISIDGADYVFRHALVREAVLADLLPGERTRLHARFAEAYQQLAGRRRVAAEISYHWLGAGDDERAFPATVEAMRQAREAFAYATAAQMGQRALELWSRVGDPDAAARMGRIELIGRTASYLRSVGDSEGSLAMVEQGLRECPPEDAQYARLLRDKAIYYGNLGVPGSIDLLEEALRRSSDDEFRVSILVALTARLMVEGHLSASVEVGEQALEAALRHDSLRNASVAANLLGCARANLGDIEGGLAGLDRARELADGDAGALLRYWVNASDLHYLLGNFEKAIELAREGLARARELGVERSSGVVLASNAVDPLLALARWQEAEEHIEQGLRLDPPAAFWVYMQRARLWGMLWKGKAEAAVAQFPRLRDRMRSLADVETQTRLGVARLETELALASGDLDDAWAAAGALLDPEVTRLPGYDLPLAWAAARVLRARREAGAGTEADESALRAALARLPRWPTAATWLPFVEAELADTVPAWEAALDAARTGTRPRFLASYAQLQLGRLALAQGERAAARERLQTAQAEADALGYGLVSRQARELADAAGLAAAASAAGDAPVLTAREQQVLDLIAEGLSNRQIGERLFISGKTASVHVSAILRKLGASTRAEAVHLASR